jgi:hypothetical protein
VPAPLRRGYRINYAKREVSIPAEAVAKDAQLAIETTRTVCQCWINPVEVVGRPYDKDAVIVIEAVDLIEEKRTRLWGNERVKIFEDKERGRRLSRFPENHLHCVFGPEVMVEVPHI